MGECVNHKNMSKEYTIALALILASILKMFGIELENGILEGLIAGVAALALAILRQRRGDINALGMRLKV